MTTEKIMGLADAYRNGNLREYNSRAALSASVQALVDERDQWKVDCAEALLERDALRLQVGQPKVEPVQEPVAWRLLNRLYHSKSEADFDWRNDSVFDNTGYCPEPLYAAPQDGLRKAAQMALDALDFLDIDDEIPNGAVDALRKELGQ